MRPIRHVPLIMCLLLIAMTASKAQDAKRKTEPAEEAVGTIWQPLIEIDSGASNQFALNESAAQILVKADNEIANEKLFEIKQEMSELITEYPSTSAGKEAAGILDKAGLKVAWNSIYPKDTFGSHTPLTR